jgi:hypothetical protein
MWGFPNLERNTGEIPQSFLTAGVQQQLEIGVDRWLHPMTVWRLESGTEDSRSRRRSTSGSLNRPAAVDHQYMAHHHVG